MHVNARPQTTNPLSAGERLENDGSPTRHRAVLGCIADDLTGASDLAGTLVREGMRVVQMVGVPSNTAVPVGDADAVVISLKSRSAPVDIAVRESLDSLQWLTDWGCRAIYFKYCSTFDSTAEGNIGPVADSLLDAVGGSLAVVAPAFPRNQRTVYAGHLFVGDVLLENSSMRTHPVTPMTESNLVTLMSAQCRGRVGLVAYRDVTKGAASIRERLEDLESDGFRYAVVDALSDRHLFSLAQAVVDRPLVTGGSALAGAIASVMRDRGSIGHSSSMPTPPTSGRSAVLAGSCSAATVGQVDLMKRDQPTYELDPAQLAENRDVAGAALAWAAEHIADGPVLIYSTAAADGVERVRRALGPDSAERVEQLMGAIARGLVATGVTKLVVAGGETSGAVVEALGITSMTVGEELAPGVPILTTGAEPGLSLVLKSGNFGAPDFFRTALERMNRSEVTDD
jgi:3-dehydrotetronate 4-kinase